MSGTPQTKTEDTKKPLTAATAAALVKRPIPQFDDEGQPTGKFKQQEVKTAEVLEFKEYADRVVVVTVDGQKFEAAL